MSAMPYTIAALVITGAACTASLATSQGAPSSEALVCELRLTETNRMVTIAAEAQARHAMRGTYQLDIDQRSAAGRSTIRQGGEFDLKAGERATLGEASFSGRAQDFNAELTVMANGQIRTCRSASL
ncbi:MAG: curli-like amyloid fiber formation chaperone CsgH [Roseinatronobacter sp.]